MKVNVNEKSGTAPISFYPVNKNGKCEKKSPSSVKSETGKDMRVNSNRGETK